MKINIQTLTEAHVGKQHELFARYLNPQMVRVLKTIGFDKNYVRAQGPYLYDDQGLEFLDFISGHGVFNMGRNHPHIRQELQRALEADLPSMVQMDAPLLAGLLAERLLSKMPAGVDTVFFTNSGTEAVEAAIKFSRRATGKNRILFLEHAFHGLTSGALSLNGNLEFRDGFGELLPGCKALPLGDLEILEQELKKGGVAALVIEPIQGKGVNYAEPDFYCRAQELCRHYGALLVTDEVQTGLGRTGKWFAFEHFGLEPDMVTVAKALSGGYIPVGAILYRRHIYNKVFHNMEACVVHSNTFGRNALAMTAGLAALAVIEDEGLVENARQMGELLLEGLSQIAKNFELIREVRGKGLMLAIEFGEPKSFSLKTAWKLIQTANKGLFAQMVILPLMKEHHILTQVSGHHTATIKLLPPLIINEQHATYFLKAFEKVMQDCHRFPGNIWKVGKDLALQASRAKREVEIF